MLNEVEQLIKMAKIAVERIDSGLALGERLDVSPLRQAIFDAEQILDDVQAYDKTREEYKMTAYEAGKQDGSLIRKTELEQAKRDGYNESTKRATEMALFNIPYTCNYGKTTARLVGIVIPDDSPISTESAPHFHNWEDGTYYSHSHKNGNVPHGHHGCRYGMPELPKITRDKLEIKKDGVFDD